MENQSHVSRNLLLAGVALAVIIMVGVVAVLVLGNRLERNLTIGEDEGSSFAASNSTSYSTLRSDNVDDVVDEVDEALQQLDAESDFADFSEIE